MGYADNDLPVNHMVLDKFGPERFANGACTGSFTSSLPGWRGFFSRPLQAEARFRYDRRRCMGDSRAAARGSDRRVSVGAAVTSSHS
jgi:hypothetical protein